MDKKEKEGKIAELTSQIKARNEELEEIKRQANAKRLEIVDLYDQITAVHAEANKDLIGKKVRISWESCISYGNYTTKTLEGYLEGFRTVNGFLGEMIVSPILYKVKKDGSKSMSEYAYYNLPKIDDIKSIEQI